MKETMIQKNDDEKTTTQPKRERERESVLRTRVIITPIIAIHISHIREKSAQNSPHKFQNSEHHKREEGTTKTISLSFGRSTFRPTK